MLKNWWKITAVLLISWSIVMGFLGPVPALPILNETIRNLYFHVTMWFSMLTLFTISIVYAILHLNASGSQTETLQTLDKKIMQNSSYSELRYDIISGQAAFVGMVFGLMGLITGSLWARYTWGYWWTNDVKLNGAAAAMMIYLAYVVLRSSVEDEHKKARLSAVYNIFAYFMMLVFVMILPRMKDSLHPGNGGNPGFSKYDLDNNMRIVFYPAVLGWILFGVWILNVRVRMQKLIMRRHS